MHACMYVHVAFHSNVWHVYHWSVYIVTCYAVYVNARMTGVGGRPEIVIEGSNEDPGNDDWKVSNT